MISTHLGILISTITLNIIRSKVSCLITPRSCDTTIFIRFFELIYYLLSTALLLLTNQNMCCIFSSEFQFSYFLKSVIKPFLNCYIYIDKASRTNCFIIRRYSQRRLLLTCYSGSQFCHCMWNKFIVMRNLQFWWLMIFIQY